MQLWTVEAARAYLPRLRELLAMVQRATTETDSGVLVVQPGSEHAEAALAELEEKGVILRQLPAGLVDFPSAGPDGEMRLLCWKTDEEDLEWWHPPDTGFAGRRRIDES